ncbi:MBOAT family O-acyltransferase [Maribacter sp. IgM3_T14_3]|uniref:MBOAT family O-acyltransferase n=1 Tax=Maribacter sp. IgM3_T14_3 TaxID=3415140 RepID=UPI003C6F8561
MSWNVEYAFLLLISTSTTFLSGILIQNASSIGRKKLYVAISLFVNLSILVLFKYYNFIGDSLTSFISIFDIEYKAPKFNLMLPVGISFYTFQALSYTMDVYQGKIKATKHFGKYALFVSFFPQLVAGPIEKSASLLPQFNSAKSFNYERIKEGLILMAWGFFKKMVIADRLAILVDTVYNNPTEYEGIELVVATFFFSIQILCDFSGYTDIAIGAAKVLGFDLSKNFNRPYFSKSIPEFWRRWHISLGSWFKDYLYFPLGGSRVVNWKKYRNILIVFIVSGLWHGASWNFLIWGLLHGMYQVLDIVLTPLMKIKNGRFNINKNNFIYKFYKVSLAFCLVSFAWIFFRANKVSDAFYIVKNLFVLNTEVILGNGIYDLGLNRTEFKVAYIALLVLLLANLLERKYNLMNLLHKQHLLVRWTYYLSLIFYILVYGVYGSNEKAAFIYFQF